MKKKLLFVITKSNFGGAQRYVYDLATNLPKEEFNITVASGGEGVLIEKLKASGVRTITLPRLGRDVSLLADAGSLSDIYQLFRSEKPDVVHLNSSKASFLGAVAARAAHVPRIIFTAHGWPFNENRSFFSRSIFLVLSWLVVVLAHRTIAVSEAVARQMRSLPFTKKKLSVIHLGIRAERLLPQMIARELLLGPKAAKFDDMPWIGTIAELHSSKGLVYAIEALTRLKHLPLVYVVVGEGGERPALEDAIRRAGLSDRVFLVGFRDHAHTLMSAFDYFLLPSTTEALSYVLLEAGLAQLPVIASAVGGIPEVVTHNRSGLLVPPRDPVAISHALNTLLKQKKLEGFGTALKERVTKKFSFKDFIERTSRAY